MWKKKERWTAAALLLAMVVVTGLCWYILYIRQQFYDEGTRNLLETYEQVDKAFTIFSRSNWNMLNEWGKSLQAANEEGLAEERLRSYEAEREIWRYSSVYLFNENCEYWSIRGKHEKVDHLWTAFEEMYRTGKPTVSSYIMRSGERRVVYSAPIAPVEIDGTTYTSLAVSYRNKTIEELIGGSAYGGQSDCYIIHPDGDVMLSEEPKSEIEDWMDNLFDYLQKHAQVDTGTLTRARQDVAEGRSGSLSCWLEGKSYYLVYQPVGFQDLSIVGIVGRDVVDSGMRKIQNATILLLAGLFFCAGIVLVHGVRTDARLHVEEKERALRQEEEARQQMEDLANTDGLTGLYNERYFDALLKENELNRTPFVLFYLDLDRFKPVNDRYGHDVGDQLLKAVAWRLRTCVRSTDYAFRIGGDEFVILCCNRKHDEVLLAVEKLRMTLRGAEYEISVGVQQGTGQENVQNIVNRAEDAMRRDKEAYYQQNGQERRMRSLNEKLDRLMQEKQDADQFIRVIAPEYIAVYLINFAQDSFRKILIPDFFRDMLDKCNGSFRRAMLEYIRLYIAPEDQEEFESLTCAQIVRERLAKEGTIDEHYKRSDGMPIHLQIMACDGLNKEESIWIFAKDTEKT